MDEGKRKRKELKDAKREAMKREYDSSKQRKAVKESFNREFRSLKRSEKQKVKKDIERELDV